MMELEPVVFEDEPIVRKHPDAVCEACPLYEGSKFVPTKFPTASGKLVVVGEAPGMQEAMYQEPFKGPSGKLLDRVLGHYNYKRDEVMYTNVCLCRPEDNATPPKAAASACRPRLIREIVSYRESGGVGDILALGGTAVSELVSDQRNISSLRVGPPKVPVKALREAGLERVVPTWHPAYCLRSPDAFPALVSDIGKLKEIRLNAWTPPEWEYIDDPLLARFALGELKQRCSRVVLDIEVGIEKDLSFGHPNEYDLLSVGLCYERGRVVVLGLNALRDKDVCNDLGDFLRRVRIIAHNGKFDLAGLYPTLGALELFGDTMLASYALDERPGNHGLKVLAVEKLGAPQYDLEIKQYIPNKGSYANIPAEILAKYNAYDCACTWDLWELFEEAMEREDVRRVHDFMVKASNQLMFLELNGIKIDRQYQRELRQILLGRIELIEEVLFGTVREALGPDWSASTQKTTDINPRSHKQIKEVLAAFQVNVESTDKETLGRILERYDPDDAVYKFAYALLDHRSESKQLSTYVEGIIRRLFRGRVYTTYLLHGTTSGRLASRNPNLQNIDRDKDIRRQFIVSKPENVLIQADFKQAEGRVIATMAQDEYLRSMFSDPTIDMFNELSDQLYGVGNWGKEERVRTKAFFYGLSYGRKAGSIAIEYKMSVREAERRLREFMSLIPATANWQQEVKAKVLRGDDLVTPFGRRRRFWLITKQNQDSVLNEALSYLPQSTASDICLSAFIRLRPRLRGLGFVRLTIHDALVVECSEDRKEEVGNILVEEMLRAGKEYTDYVPFAVDLSYGKTWGDL